MNRAALLLSSVLLLASCATDDFTGDQSLREANENEAITFGMTAPTLTRAEGAAAALALDYKFKVYGVKKVGDDYSNVFAKNTYSTGEDYSATPYDVWYTASTGGTTTSNTKDWDYVGVNGTAYGTTDHTVTLSGDQSIKYWDYSATQYEFVAYSATVSGGPTITKYQKDGFTVTGTAAQLAGLYVADKLTITDKNTSPTKPASGYNQIGNIVQLTFRAAASKVRLGIYETIPGYVVKNLKFYYTNSGDQNSTTNAYLDGSFNGTSSSASDTYAVTYDASGVPVFSTSTSASGYFDFGTFASGASDLGTTSTSPTWASGSADYQSVLPNTDHVGNMTLKVDYDLYNGTSGETIHVYGAKAVVPSTYMKWNPNYAYTYLFKISDNTNGATSTASGTPEGLFPITFDAVTIATEDASQQGIITTVTTPAITTYQNGSVSSSGITYANANGPIYITVNTNGTLATLTADNLKLYTVAAGTTEADLLLTTKTKTPVTSGDNALSILASEETQQSISFAASTTAKFTPAAGTTYALEYLTITEKTGLTAGETSVTGLYTRTGASEPYTYTKITDADAKAASETTYYEVVPQYKIIEVVAVAP